MLVCVYSVHKNVEKELGIAWTSLMLGMKLDTKERHRFVYDSLV